MEITKYNIDTRYLPFKFTAIAWHEVDDKISLLDFKVELNKHIKISDYGDNVKEIIFIFVAMRPPVRFHPERVEYNKKKHDIFMRLHLPYDLVEQYNQEQVLQLMASFYLHAMETHLPKLHIPDFDYQRFVKDVRALFEEKEWLSEKYEM
ncbi:MAG: hypothetical protein ACK4TA_11010 [Saprospiraceae bacterium]